MKYSAKVITGILLLVVQLLCAAFFVGDIVLDYFHLRAWAVSWEFYELLQIAAAVGLVIGASACTQLLLKYINENQKLTSQVDAASGKFFELLSERFKNWKLTQSEADVAVLIIRGYTNSEIAISRGTSEATIKTQINSIFKKGKLSGRNELVSQFIDVLVENPSK